MLLYQIVHTICFKQFDLTPIIRYSPTFSWTSSFLSSSIVFMSRLCWMAHVTWNAVLHVFTAHWMHAPVRSRHRLHVNAHRLDCHKPETYHTELYPTGRKVDREIQIPGLYGQSGLKPNCLNHLPWGPVSEPKFLLSRYFHTNYKIV